MKGYNSQSAEEVKEATIAALKEACESTSTHRNVPTWPEIHELFWTPSHMLVLQTHLGHHIMNMLNVAVLLESLISILQPLI